MRPVSLNAVKSGMTRLRDKGAPSPESLYELTNGYRTAAGSIRNRPGTRIDIILPPGTKGLVGFEGKQHVFCAEPVTISDVGYVTGLEYVAHILRHPTDLGRELAVIHFAQPFMGFLYVVAEFDNGDVYHYWLEEIDTWEAQTVYSEGDRVAPTVPNGFMYRATRLTSAGTPWAPNVTRTVGEVIEPTTSNGFSYECIATTGANPASGATEPNWPASDGAIVIELTDGDPTTPPEPVVTDPPPSGGGYTNPGGARPPDQRGGINFIEP